MKILKATLFSMLIHLYMQLDILLQIKSYDSNLGVSDFLLIVLPIIFAIVVYCVFKHLSKKEFWITTFLFVAIYIMFIFLGNSTNYFKWLFNLVNLSIYYDGSQNCYEHGINAMVDGVLHTICFLIPATICLIKNRRVK